MSYYLERIVVYANERSHQDTAVSKYQAYVSKAETLTVQASGALAFASPEILQIDDKRLESFTVRAMSLCTISVRLMR